MNNVGPGSKPAQIGQIMDKAGWIKGAWFLSDCPESKFMRPCKKYLYSRKDREEFRKLKRKNKRLGIKNSPITDLDPDKIYEYKQSTWNSVATIRRYYEKTFKNIKLKKINGVDCG